MVHNIEQPKEHSLRIDFLDIAKGIEIILVVVGHNFKNDSNLWLCVKFHMIVDLS
jgi:fucose 4-O-acetylase-like acetyltransferase